LNGLNISPARRIAYTVLRSVSEDGYATDLLLEHAAHLSSRDAGLASQIVFGCLRYQAQLDYLIQHYSGRKLDAIEQPVILLLRIGIFQLRYLDRIPSHAAVHETVEMAKQHRRAAAGFVNAVLRKVNRNPVRWPNRQVELSCPEWLLDRWAEHFGIKQATAIALAALQEPEHYVRIAHGELPANAEFEATDVPGCFKVIGGDTQGLRFQDIGSQAIVPLLDLQPGQSYLDLCSAPGNKTSQALEIPVEAIACDISFRRLREVPAICPRLVLDATQPLPFLKKFDRIFIDAPCSGTGTLSRNPEIKWRVKTDDFTRLQDRQIRIVKRALARLAPGGRLVYATCSLEPEENEEVVRQVVMGGDARHKVAHEMWRLPGREPGDGFYAAVIISDELKR
jgi:16S rRNA (cytosine967-C5)-methyltransferase